jgi:transposase
MTITAPVPRPARVTAVDNVTARISFDVSSVNTKSLPGGVSRRTRVPRYPSDMSEAEWAVCEPSLSAPAWRAGRGGRPAAWCMRDIVDAIRYLTHNGAVWRALSADFPPAGTVYWWMDKWQADRSTERMHDDLSERIRLAAGRNAAPTAAVIDSQSVKGSEMTAFTPASSSPGQGKHSTSPWKSSGAPMTRTPSRSCPAGGW